MGWRDRLAVKTYGAIKSVPPAKNLATKRAIQEKAVAAVDQGVTEGLKGKKPSDKLKQSISKTKRDASKSMKNISYKWDELVSKQKSRDRKHKRKVFGGASAIVAGTVGAHSVAKKKFPKYKKVMESDITIKDGKLGLKPRKSSGRGPGGR